MNAFNHETAFENAWKTLTFVAMLQRIKVRVYVISMKASLSSGYDCVCVDQSICHGYDQAILLGRCMSAIDSHITDN